MLNTNTRQQQLGVLIHGRHLQTVDWEYLLWGDPIEGRLGTGPTAVATMLNLGPEQVKLIYIGSGASIRMDGTFEAEAIKQLLLSRFESLGDFEVIRTHPAWSRSRSTLRRLVESAETDIVAKNTTDEIKNAAQLFTSEGIRLVAEVTGESHGPRCQIEQSAAREAGIIPSNQRWLLITDDTPYAGSSARSTLVIEPPHRGDDPSLMRPEDERPERLFRYYFTLPSDKKGEYLKKIAVINNELTREDHVGTP